MTSDSSSLRLDRSFAWVDLLVLAALLAFIYGLLAVAREWAGPLQPIAEIHTEARYLPLYALFSLARGVCAYGVSLVFTLLYGYAMARARGGETILGPLLDILQSVPVLGFLPGLVLGLVHLFPHRNLGLEIASVLMIFTGQAWNMTFAFYASLKSVPPELVAVTQLSRLSWWQRFITLDLSYATTGLVWNSMLSMAGGWFFLTVSEAFVLGDHDFRLPGLGSYMSLAIERGDITSQILGVTAMLLMILFFDQVVWRPLVAWSQKFTDEEPTPVHHSWMWERVRRSWTWRVGSDFAGRVFFGFLRGVRAAGSRMSIPMRKEHNSFRWVFAVIWAVLGGLTLLGVAHYLMMLVTLSKTDWAELFWGVGITFLRILAAVLLASLWAIPAGVWIGTHPRWTRALQPLIQMAASFPAPMIFPLVVGGLMQLGVGLSLSSVVLLMLGTQWYVLFNVIAGTSAIPRELWEVTRLGRFSRRECWMRLVLPAIFPSLLTGWMTAMGGAWNASIVAEYMKLNGSILTTSGLGSIISRATEHGDFHVLAAAVGIMSISVVVFNRLVWRRLSRYAQTRYSMST